MRCFFLSLGDGFSLLFSAVPHDPAPIWHKAKKTCHKAKIVMDLLFAAVFAFLMYVLGVLKLWLSNSPSDDKARHIQCGLMLWRLRMGKKIRQAASVQCCVFTQDDNVQGTAIRNVQIMNWIYRPCRVLQHHFMPTFCLHVHNIEINQVPLLAVARKKCAM